MSIIYWCLTWVHCLFKSLSRGSCDILCRWAHLLCLSGPNLLRLKSDILLSFLQTCLCRTVNSVSSSTGWKLLPFFSLFFLIAWLRLCGRGVPAGSPGFQLQHLLSHCLIYVCSISEAVFCICSRGERQRVSVHRFSLVHKRNHNENVSFNIAYYYGCSGPSNFSVIQSQFSPPVTLSLIPHLRVCCTSLSWSADLVALSLRPHSGVLPQTQVAKINSETRV